MTRSITVVLACHNRKAETLACLDHVARQDAAAAARIVLFDDGSTDGTADAVRARHPAATLIEGRGDAFWAGGMRVAFAHAVTDTPDFCLWLNDDVRLAPDALARLLATHDELAASGHPLCLVGGAVRDPATGATSYAGVVRPRRDRPLRFCVQGPDPRAIKRCDTLVGNVVLIPRHTAERIGGIDPAYRHTLGDLDYGLRVTAAGGRCALAPGHVGTCGSNKRPGRWFNPDLALWARWRLLLHPLGFPPGPWLHFARRHGGPWWPAFAPLPFWRLVLPRVLARIVDQRRRIATSFRHA